jgi:hypothetical protein
LKHNVPVPSVEIQKRIGDLILKAYNKRNETNKTENEAIKLLEDKMTKLNLEINRFRKIT